jgi:predicted small metal-binding protein
VSGGARSIRSRIIVKSRKEPSMKIMTCKELGGNCDQKLSAESWDEMVKVMTRHVMEKHPDVAKEMEKMHKQDPQKWGKEMKPKWDAAPEH